MASSSVVFNAHGPVVSSEFMHHRHVARAIIPNYEGDLESLPAQFISEDYDESKMRAIVLLIDGASGEIVNCLGANFNELQSSAVGALALASHSSKLFPNPTSQSTTLEFDSPVAHMASLTIVDAQVLVNEKLFVSAR